MEFKTQGVEARVWVKSRVGASDKLNPALSPLVPPLLSAHSIKRVPRGSNMISEKKIGNMYAMRYVLHSTGLHCDAAVRVRAQTVAVLVRVRVGELRSS